MLLHNDQVQHVSTTAHAGKLVVIATCDDRSLRHTVRQDGYEQSGLQAQGPLTGWQGWRPLPVPDDAVGDPSVTQRKQASLSIPSGAPAAVREGRYLGTRVGGLFLGSGYSLAGLAPGWHHVAAVKLSAEDKATLSPRHPGREIVRAAEPPYLGNSASMSGDRLADQNPYAAIVQEHVLHPVPGMPSGSTLTLKLPLAEPGADPERVDVPAGVKTIEIAEFRDGAWQMLTDIDEVELEFKLALLNSSLFKYDATPFEQAFAQAKRLFPKQAYFPKTEERAVREAGQGAARAILHTGRGGDGRDAVRLRPAKRKKRSQKKTSA